MVQSVITLEEHPDRVVSIVKGKYGLKNKSDAINFIVRKYEQEFLEPELRPEYQEELLRIDQGKFRKFSGVQELRRKLSHD
ncbi:MAG: DUF2683 family protein [Candidatus Diapherotrites archaeon]|nr:DUF2683 family protein [Candidatus Diapherotrites archaeon]